MRCRSASCFPRHQCGIALLFYVLMVVALVGLLSATLLRGGDALQAFSSGNFVASLNGQAALIRSRVLACAIDYPAGDNGSGFQPRYPAAPTATAVSTLLCPGSGRNLWNGDDGVNLPPALSGVAPWSYVNDATSIRIAVTAGNGERAALLVDAAAQLGPQAVVAGNTLTWTLVAAP